MFARSDNSTSLRRVRARLRQIEARREAIIAAVMEAGDRRLFRHQYPDTAELEDLFAEADMLRQELDAKVAVLRTLVWGGDGALQERRARELDGLRVAAKPAGPGLGARLLARVASAWSTGAAEA